MRLPIGFHLEAGVHREVDHFRCDDIVCDACSPPLLPARRVMVHFLVLMLVLLVLLLVLEQQYGTGLARLLLQYKGQAPIH